MVYPGRSLPLYDLFFILKRSIAELTIGSDVLCGCVSHLGIVANAPSTPGMSTFPSQLFKQLGQHDGRQLSIHLKVTTPLQPLQTSSLIRIYT